MTDNNNELKSYLQTYVDSITKKSKGGFYICPLCSSGTGRNGTGAFRVYDNGLSWKCFSCEKGGDFIDLIGEVEHITDYGEKKKRAEEIAGAYQKQPKSKQYTHTHNSIHIKKATEEADYTDFFLSAHKHIKETSYPLQRGLSEAVINKYKLGFVEEWRHPKAPNAPASPRLIIPTSKSSYLARDTRSQVPAGEEPYKKSKVGNIHTFNIKALATATEPVFITEGEIDALSIIEAGGMAVALGSANRVRGFIEDIKEMNINQPFILALDADTKGEEWTEKLEEELETLGIHSYRASIYGNYKDANEALVADREGFISLMETARDGAITAEKAVEEAEKEAYLKTSTDHYLQAFIDGVADSVNTPSISTGFTNLDCVLDGGLYEGLYTIGAISSLGKTTLVTQIADQIAESGQHILLFSLEMARNELIAKSISRETLKEVMAENGDTKNAKTARGITAGWRYTDYSQTERELINSSVEEYSKYAGNIYIVEAMGEVGVREIREAVDRHISFTGKTPVVIIDYLQILAPYNDRWGDKQNTDKAVLELKRISRDYKIPVIAISSLNRSNYKAEIDMEAFKESGAIEYTSDILIGLQLKGAGKKDFDYKKAKNKPVREVELVILKNRNASTGSKIEFKYYPMFNFFEEV